MEIEDLINSVKIEDYIGQFVDLEAQNGELFGLSPFKQEKTPSFSVTPSTQLFYDFSSHVGGNVLTFIQKYNNCTFGEALDILKKHTNHSSEPSAKKPSAIRIMRQFMEIERKKKTGNREILPADYMNRYTKDYDKLQGWIDEGISPEILEKYDVRYDPFANRIVYPIRTVSGNIISVKGRTLDPDYKEKGLRKYTYYQRLGTLDIIFGYFEHIDDYKKQDEIILFEGEKSVMLCNTWGIKNAGALLTSRLNPSQLKMLLQLGVKVIFAFDKDVDIKSDDNIKKLARFMRVEYVKDVGDLLDEKDSPVDKGLEIWNKLYEGRCVYR